VKKGAGHPHLGVPERALAGHPRQWGGDSQGQGIASGGGLTRTRQTQAAKKKAKEINSGIRGRERKTTHRGRVTRKRRDIFRPKKKRGQVGEPGRPEERY